MAAVAGEWQIPMEARKEVQKLATAWDDVEDSRALEVVPLKGAMTNEVFQIRWPVAGEEKSRNVLLRMYGEGVGHFFDRANEIKTFEFMSRHGHGPRLLACFPNGRVEEFIHAKTLSAADLRDVEISALIASKLREFHDLNMTGPNTVHIWDRLRNWLNAARRLCSYEEIKAINLDMIEKEISSLENDLSGKEERIGFCHNDLQYGNIMIEEETKMLTIIDYEYASFNPIAYDIANHFCEMAADYHTETPHILNYNKYPDHEEQKRFVQIYLSFSGNKPYPLEVENLLASIEKYTLVSHLIWGLWGLISDHVNDTDFDYLEYANQRFHQYWSQKVKEL
ncbi:probable choline kinase 2 [Dendrobium catenatum]|uniref:Choline/ethanolamine kinase n=1 Tax=Dendrobium catenatum TaxID=906689 RepID=A0A2I0XG82_9ASPA|nr:probable choline kinase 2 [Dendrobium catenatum]PKU86918.1 choline/ethanolamine kinase [Dendrobium catenatum]